MLYLFLFKNNLLLYKHLPMSTNNTNLNSMQKLPNASMMWRSLLLIFCCSILASANSQAQTSPVTLHIQLRGVAQSDIMMMPFRNGRWQENSRYLATANNGGSVRITLDSADLPGEFVIRYKYKSKPEDTPYPAEQAIFINNQSISFSVNPPYCNNADSLQYAATERENNLWRRFNAEKARRMQPLQLLQPVLMNYDNPKAPMYAAVRAEYDRRLKDYNGWLQHWQRQYAGYYVASLFQFSRQPFIQFRGTEHSSTNITRACSLPILVWCGAPSLPIGLPRM
jgi:hypothetical protein